MQEQIQEELRDGHIRSKYIVRDSQTTKKYDSLKGTECLGGDSYISGLHIWMTKNIVLRMRKNKLIDGRAPVWSCIRKAWQTQL